MFHQFKMQNLNNIKATDFTFVFKSLNLLSGMLKDYTFYPVRQIIFVQLCLDLVYING